MAIGTSLGAYFESPFHHQSGIETPPDTGDDNVLPPDSETQSNPSKEAKVIPAMDSSKFKSSSEIEDRRKEHFNSFPQSPQMQNVFEMGDGTMTALNPNFDDFIKSGETKLGNELGVGDLNPTLIHPIADVRGINKTPFKIQLPDAFGGSVRSPERIKSAAMKIDGELYEAENHGMAINKYMDENPEKPFPKWEDRDEGFTTTHGRFVSREKAFDLARERDQIRPEVLPALTPDSTMLLSEDLIQP